MKITISVIFAVGLISMVGCSSLPSMGTQPVKAKPVKISKAGAAIEGTMDVVENFENLDEGCLGKLAAFKVCEQAPQGPFGVYRKGCDYAAETNFECAVSSETLRSFMSFL